jgi:hypothetical protein
MATIRYRGFTASIFGRYGCWQCTSTKAVVYTEWKSGRRAQEVKTGDLFGNERTDIEMGLCLSGLFVLCEEFRKRGLQDAEIDGLIGKVHAPLKKIGARPPGIGASSLTAPFYERIRLLLAAFSDFWTAFGSARGPVRGGPAHRP